jgi:hypothetical protein
MAEQMEFKFPDEVEQEDKAEAVAEAKDNNEFEVQIEDDTPPQDRGRVPLPKEVVDELEKDDLEEYSEKVKKRLSQMKKVWHDERREKERALREREEALRFAQLRESEIRQLKQRLGNGEKAYIQEVTKAANNDLVTAKERLKQAYESGDAEKITDAQEALTEAKLKIKQYENFRPSLQKEDTGVQQYQQYQVPPAPQPVTDPKAEAWKENNPWFGTDEEMTALALGLHEKLVRSGVDPRSDDYYDRVNATMRKRFPDYFEDAPIQTKEAEKPARTKPATVVAPVTRSSGPKQVRLTPSQVALAKKLGLSNQEYAKAMIELENNNG